MNPPLKVLVVDDVPLNRKLLRVALETEGYQVLEAANGVEALAVLAREEIKAVVSDVLMPEMDGFRLCQEIRKNQKWAALPYIMYTATFTSPKDMELAEAVGADRYLIKQGSAQPVLLALIELAKGGGAQRGRGLKAAEEVAVMKLYNEALVNKLEEKSHRLEQAVGDSHQARQEILELNANLERRVEERTAALEKSNRELTEALAKVQELSGLLPICCYCKRVRDDQDYWHTVEDYVTKYSKAKFSHGYCPECPQKHVLPEIEQLERLRKEEL